MTTETLTNKTSKEHYQKYEDMVLKLGLGEYALDGIVMGRDKDYWMKKYQEDEHLNSHPLDQFDIQDAWVRSIAFNSGFKSWSLCSTVCCIKHLILYKLLKLEPVFTD